MGYNEQIMSVKLKMPQPRKNYIAREQLFRQLEEIVDNKVTVVKAGAGSGKTTLLVSFLREKGFEDVKWISLDESVNQVFIFWKYVLEALKVYFDGSDNGLRELFDGNIQKENLCAILSLFLSKLSSRDIILVLDDFHTIDEPFLISTVDYFIENLPDNLHLVFLTRNMPQLYLGSLAVEGSILVLEEDAIRFGREESLEFLRSTMKLECEEVLLNEMIEASEGWIGGLQLLAVSLKDRNSQYAAGLKISAKMTDDYISREIFAYLSDAEQYFLIKTGILRYFSEEFCSRYLPEINFNYMIESVQKKNLFVISMDESARIFRYHAILSEYLNKLCEETQSEEAVTLHRTAAEIYYGLGDYEESLYHLFLIKDYKKIMEQLLLMPHNALTYTYMMKVPTEAIIYNPDFAFQYFFCYYISLDDAACARIHEFIKKNMDKNLIFDAFQNVNFFYADAWEFHKINVLSLEQINALPLNQVTRAFLLIKEAYFLYATSRYVEALEYGSRAEEYFRKSGNIYVGFFILSEKAQIYEDMGELNQCLILYKEMESMLPFLKTAVPSYYVGITGVYLKKLELGKAYEALQKAKAVIPAGDNLNMERAYLYNLAEYSYIAGDNEATDDILKEVMGQEVAGSIYYAARLLRYPINRGKQRELAKWFMENYESTTHDVKYLDCDLLYACIQYEYDNASEALKLVENIISNARKTQNKLKIVEGDLLKARILSEHNGNKRELLNLFIESISYAAEDKLALPFWFEKAITNKLFKENEQELRTKLSAPEWDFLINILNPVIERKPEEPLKDNYDLTAREIEVLIELAKGNSNKEIADNLCISLATVKSHIINLYGKLGVNNRVAAAKIGEGYLVSSACRNSQVR